MPEATFVPLRVEAPRHLFTLPDTQAALQVPSVSQRLQVEHQLDEAHAQIPFILRMSSTEVPLI